MPVKKYDEIVKQLAEMENNWKRALADYQNLVKRTQDQQMIMRNFACLSLVERLLPAMDHLELAAAHLKDAGLDMVVSQFRQALIDEGVVEIEAINRVFDPNLMECVDKIEGEENKVLEVVSRGYEMQNKVIRPAKVKVGSKKINDSSNEKEA